ncbi:glycosyltransferase family 4 protein [Pelagicoccus sp. SDUM812002]|uniref:glycosyltransferase family 4 protein n=1 Tax=Pelagicoccus sp. SDUM812002 TaxID=3041266 RepID=UPI00280DFBCB|nr:glycosyltransferase family 4 protein [Pelagicoccus sp. SDUM812002]MDQ8186840.1 glycosyltransferase family 4 protein [Pelagicoccus sp. SDUM812002]
MIIRKWLSKVDCLLFCETPVRDDLLAIAHSMGIPSVCIVNWEWLAPYLPWVRDVDLFLAPNSHTYDLLTQWKAKSLPRIKVERIPGLVDVDRFSFKERAVCRSFLFVNGRGGFAPTIRGLYRDRLGPPRKGLEVVLKAARLAPEVPIKIRSQIPIENDLPANVELLPSEEDNTKLYDTGDVAVQPSLLEGTGLQMIEMMATGLPLITTNAPPMNEFPALDLIDCRSKLGKARRHIIDVNFPSAAHLARLMQVRLGTSVVAESRLSRQYVMEHHSWDALSERFMDLFNQGR